MKPDARSMSSSPEPFPRDDAMWRLIGESKSFNVGLLDTSRTDRLVNRVMESIGPCDGVLVAGNFRRDAAWGAILGVAAAIAVVGFVAFFGVDGGVNAEVNALASLAEVHGVDLSGGDQFLIAHLDELLETDLHALWLEPTLE